MILITYYFLCLSYNYGLKILLIVAWIFCNIHQVPNLRQVPHYILYNKNEKGMLSILKEISIRWEMHKQS